MFSRIGDFLDRVTSLVMWPVQNGRLRHKAAYLAALGVAAEHGIYKGIDLIKGETPSENKAKVEHVEPAAPENPNQPGSKITKFDGVFPAADTKQVSVAPTPTR